MSLERKDRGADGKKAFYIADHILRLIIDILPFSRDRSKVREAFRFRYASNVRSDSIRSVSDR